MLSNPTAPGILNTHVAVVAHSVASDFLFCGCNSMYHIVIQVVTALLTHCQTAPSGTQLKAQGQRVEAQDKYTEAVQICPTYADGFYDLGVYYSENQQV